MITNNELEGTWKEAVLAQFQVEELKKATKTPTRIIAVPA
jgi:hypothetical protein